jgi:probable HAF family extracellular repeat protein
LAKNESLVEALVMVRILRCLASLSLVVFVFMKATVARDNSTVEPSSSQLRYRFVDMGTFGGHNSGVDGGTVVVNRHNVAVGGADTAEPCPYAPDLPISPAFKWENGKKAPLALLPGGCSGFALAINDHGLIVGVADNGLIDPSTGAPQMRAVMWSDGHVRDLGTFGGGNGLAVAVNERGQIVGFAQNAEFDPFDFGDQFLFGLPSSNQWRGFLWEDGIMNDLGTLGGSDAAATGDLPLNNRGDIAGYSFTSDVVNGATGVPTLDSFVWRNGQLHDLGTLGGTITQAFTMNSRSQVVGTSSIAGDTEFHAFFWDRGRMHDLGSLGGSFANAGWVNDQGEPVGASLLPGDNVLRAFIVRNGLVEQLGTLEGDDCSDAFVINNKSQVVGHSFPCDSDADRGYVWQNGVITDLNDFVPENSSIVIGSAGYISDNGVIAAAGRLPNGDTRAIILIPCSEGERDCRAAHHRARSQQPKPDQTKAKSVLKPTPREGFGKFIQHQQCSFHQYVERSSRLSNAKTVKVNQNR